MVDAGRHTLDRHSARGTGRSGGWRSGAARRVSRVRGEESAISRWDALDAVGPAVQLLDGLGVAAQQGALAAGRLRAGQQGDERAAAEDDRRGGRLGRAARGGHDRGAVGDGQVLDAGRGPLTS